MYVSLEPCCTHGRTPPCTSALIAAGFVRVVAAAIDPTPSVNGEGMQALTQAGIEVGLAEGDVERRARRQNEGLRKVHTLGLPFVLYKYAMTLDGRIAVDSGDSRWVSSPESRALVHRWRAGFDAVVVGSGTLRSDDPRLTARGRSCSRQPLRVVVDSECGLGADSSLVRTANEGPVLVVCGEGVTPERRSEVRSWGVDTAVVKRATDGGLEPEAVCRELAARGVQYALLEGGPRLAGSWWAAGMIDKVAAFVSPRIASGIEGKTPFFGPGVESMERAATLTEVRTRAVGCDVLVTGYRGEPY
jgi:diaminohydroxyphosphoribosylaminopyrimidine deaminase/5-amino-6-(5-phosphoribosylamino)uracil reductase